MQNRRVVWLLVIMILAIMALTPIAMYLSGIEKREQVKPPSEIAREYSSGRLAESIYLWRKELDSHLLHNDEKVLANLLFARKQVLADERYQPGLMDRIYLELSDKHIVLLGFGIVFLICSWGFRHRSPREEYYGLSVSRRHRFFNTLTCVLGVIFLVIASYPWVHESLSPSWAVVKTDQIILRSGNGMSYDPVSQNRVALKLPEGLELFVLSRRTNGWSHVKLFDGTEGWVPDEALLRSGE